MELNGCSDKSLKILTNIILDWSTNRYIGNKGIKIAGIHSLLLRVRCHASFSAEKDSITIRVNIFRRTIIERCQCFPTLRRCRSLERTIIPSGGPPPALPDFSGRAIIPSGGPLSNAVRAFRHCDDVRDSL